MAIYCNYHPLNYAAFSCPKCHANLCPSCVVKKKREAFGGGHAEDIYLCPKCTVFVEKLSFAMAIEPFWKRIPAIFQYPLHLQPVALILILSLIQTLFTSRTITSVIVNMLCAGTMLTYACLVLSASANGRLSPPPIDFEQIYRNFGLYFKQACLYGLIIALAVVLFIKLFPHFGLESTSKLTIAFIALIMLFLPAMIIMLAVTRSFFASILPHVFIMLAVRIGWPYLAMYFFLMLLLLPAFLADVIKMTLPLGILYFLGTAFSSYYMIVAYHLMGYTLFQFHEKAGFQIDYEGDFHTSVTNDLQAGPAAKAAENHADHLLNTVNLLIRDGNHDAAIAEMQQNSRRIGEDPVLADRYFNLLNLRQMTPELLAFAPGYIKLMNKSGQKDKICAAYLYCLQFRPDFLEDDPETFFQMGKILLEGNYYMEALKIFDRFIQVYRHHAMVPNCYFYIARIFNERTNNPARAMKIIEWLNKTYPFHENASFVQAYARQIKV